ncbi:MAG TPA: VTT domain-containing protein [Candidatus Limnocylindrales bacterium]|nr:VTT domain-containing protein [Candidatus Limnocylindrales bacterium]
MSSILQPGSTVWRIAQARRASVLADGEAYYGAVASAIAKARHSIFIIGWDAHSRIALLRNGHSDNLPVRLGPRLGAMLRRRPQLHVYVLVWDFLIIFQHERETRWRWRTRWPRSDRFQFRFDNVHPSGASHHQKIVLVDDNVVFNGGMDLGLGRWDTTEHRIGDERRNDPGWREYVPAHDVMMVADGEVARVMGELVRERWRRCTGEEPRAPVEDTHDCWPDRVGVDFADVGVGISRTVPACPGQEPVQEIEALHLAALRAARRRIFMENQYLTCTRAVSVLLERLRESDGPEVVIILPQNNFGWFETRTIQVLHFQAIRRLREADRYGRLRICYPVVPDIGSKQINLHSKVLIIDDELLRVGSSNLTNRSMALDTECDFSIEAHGDARIGAGIAAIRARLLGEHLALAPHEVQRALDGGGSMIELYDSRAEQPRCLAQICPDVQPGPDLGDGSLIDPREPITAQTIIECYAPREIRKHARPRLLRIALALTVIAALGAVWQLTPLREWIEPEAMAATVQRLREAPATPLLVLGIYLAASMLMVPIMVVILATASVFGPVLGIAYSIVGSLAGALVTYWIGRVVGRSTVEQMTGARFRRVADTLKNRGLITMIVIRLLPIAPFTVVNMVLGSAGVGVRDYALGTVLGMMPGILGISLLQAQLAAAIRRPSVTSLAVLALTTAVVASAVVWLRRRLRVAPS